MYTWILEQNNSKVSGQPVASKAQSVADSTRLVVASQCAHMQQGGVKTAWGNTGGGDAQAHGSLLNFPVDVKIWQHESCFHMVDMKGKRRGASMVGGLAAWR